MPPDETVTPGVRPSRGRAAYGPDILIGNCPGSDASCTHKRDSETAPGVGFQVDRRFLVSADVLHAFIDPLAVSWLDQIGVGPCTRGEIGVARFHG